MWWDINGYYIKIHIDDLFTLFKSRVSTYGGLSKWDHGRLSSSLIISYNQLLGWCLARPRPV